MTGCAPRCARLYRKLHRGQLRMSGLIPFWEPSGFDWCDSRKGLVLKPRRPISSDCWPFISLWTDVPSSLWWLIFSNFNLNQPVQRLLCVLIFMAINCELFIKWRKYIRSVYSILPWADIFAATVQSTCAMLRNAGLSEIRIIDSPYGVLLTLQFPRAADAAPILVPFPDVQHPGAGGLD